MKLQNILISHVATDDNETLEKQNVFIILGAGKATRFFDFGKEYSKLILPYNNKPLIIHNIENIIEYDPNAKIVISLPEDRKIADSVSNAILLYLHDIKNEIVFVRQKPYGPGYSISNIVNDESIIKTEKTKSINIILGDIVADKQDFKRFFFHSNLDEFDLSLSVSLNIVGNDWARWCLVDLKNFNDHLALIDKPKINPKGDNKLHALTGLYSFKNIKKLKNVCKDILTYASDEVEVKNLDIQISSIINFYASEKAYISRIVSIRDFGTISDWKNNNNISKSRSFNEIYLDYDNNFVIKKSNDIQKMYNEYNWLRINNENPKLSKYMPKVFRFYQNSYELEIIKDPTLRELFIFLDRSEETWVDVFNKIFNYIDDSELYNPELSTTNEIIKKHIKEIWYKTKQRIEDLPDFIVELMSNKNIISNFMKDFEIVLNELKREINAVHILHGDLCFSNIFYNSSNIKLIDPNGRYTGIIEYDLAKLMHSVMYYYDFIDSNLYYQSIGETVILSEGCDKIANIFIDKLKEYGYNIQSIRLLTASLFLSMIPLHSHSKDNQKLYFDMFKRIYNEWLLNQNKK